MYGPCESVFLHEKKNCDFIIFFLRREIFIGVRQQWEIMLLLLSPIVTSFTSKDAGPSLSNAFPVLHVAVI